MKEHAPFFGERKEIKNNNKAGASLRPRGKRMHPLLIEIYFSVNQIFFRKMDNEYLHFWEKNHDRKDYARKGKNVKDVSYNVPGRQGIFIFFHAAFP
jgi:hypothetical protein